MRVEARATFRHSPALEGERAVLSLVVAVLGRLLDHIVAALGRFAGTVPSLIIGTPARIAGGRASRKRVGTVGIFLFAVFVRLLRDPEVGEGVQDTR